MPRKRTDAGRTATVERPHGIPLRRRLDRDASPSALTFRLLRALDPDDLRRSLIEELEARMPGARALVSLVPQSSHPDLVSGIEGPQPWRPGTAMPPVLAMPIVDTSESQGWLAFARDPAIRSREEEAEGVLALVADAAGLAARNARRYGRALALGVTDALTGTANRRGFEAALDREEETYQRCRRPLAAAIFDLDGFKSINDTLGHAAGDEALVAFARLLGDAVRRSDLVARLGGDEFAILLPGERTRGAHVVIGRVRAALEKREFRIGGKSLRLSVSVGVSDMGLARGNARRMIALADRALYRDKQRHHGAEGDPR